MLRSTQLGQKQFTYKLGGNVKKKIIPFPTM